MCPESENERLYFAIKNKVIVLKKDTQWEEISNNVSEEVKNVLGKTKQDNKPEKETKKTWEK
jgi:hypothetical protein